VAKGLLSVVAVAAVAGMVAVVVVKMAEVKILVAVVAVLLVTMGYLPLYEIYLAVALLLKLLDVLLSISNTRQSAVATTLKFVTACQSSSSVAT
jgi:hypothetical protein